MPGKPEPKFATIYVLCDASGPRYVGKTTRTLKVRLRQHLYEAKKNLKPSHRNNWLRSLDRPPEIVALEVVPLAEASEAEIRTIAKYRALGAKLTNGTDGGEGATGAKRTPEFKAALSARLTEFWRLVHAGVLPKPRNGGYRGYSPEAVENRRSLRKRYWEDVKAGRKPPPKREKKNYAPFPLTFAHSVLSHAALWFRVEIYGSHLFHTHVDSEHCCELLATAAVADDNLLAIIRADASLYGLIRLSPCDGRQYRIVHALSFTPRDPAAGTAVQEMVSLMERYAADWGHMKTALAGFGVSNLDDLSVMSIAS